MKSHLPYTLSRVTAAASSDLENCGRCTTERVLGWGNVSRAQMFRCTQLFMLILLCSVFMCCFRCLPYFGNIIPVANGRDNVRTATGKR